MSENNICLSFVEFTDWFNRRIIFQSVEGTVTSNRSHSKYNKEEIEMVLHFIRELLKPNNMFGRTVEPSDIGIVTPYKAQSLEISKIAYDLYDGIQVDTARAFQGKEKPVMIISTVAVGATTKFMTDPRVRQEKL